jgi:hypothetical protein
MVLKAKNNKSEIILQIKNLGAFQPYDKKGKEVRGGGGFFPKPPLNR